jgi:type IV pilus assembly protein PilV
MSPARRALQRAYTVVEVMMALAVLTLGASGVIAMQKATLIANTNARNVVTATSIAQAWMERMRADALAWNEPAKTPDLGDTQWLNLAVGTQPLGSGWFSPTSSPMTNPQPGGSPQADVMGADIFSGDLSATAFCTQVRLTRFGTAPNLWSISRMIRVEVRVYWDKTSRPLDCTAALPADYQLGRYGFVYLVSSVLENNSPI